MNKYEKWYNNIINSAKIRTLEGYLEKHHILPESLGGSNDPTNLVKLTAREHFICHWLLTKIYCKGEEHWKMLNALRIMRAENTNQIRYETKITSRVYEKLKEEYSILQSQRYSGCGNNMFGKKHSVEAKQKISEANSGDKNGAKQEQARKKISESKIGKTRTPFSIEWKDKLSNNHKSKQPGFQGAISEETRKKIGDKIRDRKQTDEEKEKRRLANLGLKREKKLCPHCDKLVAVNTYPRWHGDNCKQKATK